MAVSAGRDKNRFITWHAILANRHQGVLEFARRLIPICLLAGQSPIEDGLKSGDRVLFAKYSGSDTKVDGTEYIIMREEDVLGILDTGARSTQNPS